MPGNTLWNLYKLMYKRGGKCLGSLNTYSSNNLRSWRSKTSSSEPVGDGFGSHQIIRTREFAHQILENYQKIIVEKTAKPKRILPKPFWSFYSLFFTYNWQMRTILGKKYVLEDKCIKCGLCSDKICPSGCISLNNEGVPVFNESKCVGCQGCVSLCPELAIETKKCKNKYPYDIYRKYLLKSLPVEEEL